MQQNNPTIRTIQLWPHTTGKYHVVDLAGNAPQKRGTTRAAQCYVQESARQLLRSGVPSSRVSMDLKIGVVKPQFLEWLEEGMQEMVNRQTSIMYSYIHHVLMVIGRRCTLLGCRYICPPPPPAGAA